MTITKVKYEKLFPTGVYLNEKIGFEADIAIARNIETGERLEMDSPQKAIEQLRQLAEDIHKQKYPQYYQDNGEMLPQDVVQIQQIPNEKSSKERTIDALIQDINSCKEIKVLESYRFIVKTNPELQDAYNKKLQSLQK